MGKTARTEAASDSGGIARSRDGTVREQTARILHDLIGHVRASFGRKLPIAQESNWKKLRSMQVPWWAL
jgi:hypothetical protein